MTPFYLNPPPSVPFVGVDQSQDHLPLTPTSQNTSSSCHIFFSQREDQGQGDHVTDQKPQQLHRHEDNDEQVWTGKASDHDFHVSPSFPMVDRNDCDGIKASICKHDDHGLCDSGPPRWMSSKMRLMRKMMNSNRMVENKLTSGAQTSQSGPGSSSCGDDNNNNGNSNMLNSTIRVCSDCKTTKTPLWRGGPQGPKSLCNACGIRQRKARTAMAAAAGGGVMATQPSSMTNKVPKEKQINCNNQFKKRCKLSSPSANKKLQFDDFTISLSKNSAFHRVFPQDEKEAAILLMALSYGLVNS